MLHVYICLSVFSINCSNKLILTETEGATKNGQSRETGNTGGTRHKTKTNKKHKPQTNVLDTAMRKHIEIT